MPRRPAGTWTTTRRPGRSPCPTRSPLPSATARAEPSSTRGPPCSPRWARASRRSATPSAPGRDSDGQQRTAQLWQRSGGNPFFVRELIRLLQAQGSWHQPAQIPASVAETLRRRLARLSTECVRLLEWAAIAGRDVDVALLAHGAAAGREPAALSLPDEARQAGVISGTSPPRFTHDLYRETILDGLSTSARTAINLSVGRALQARSGPAARVAAHLLAAGPQARQEALEYSLLAARDTAAAEAHFRAALAMHERLGAAGWARLSEQALAGLLAAPASRAANEVRLVNGVRLLCYEGKQVQLPDSKGLGDIAALIGARGADVHVLTLVGHRLTRMGADPVLDEKAKAAYKARLAGLAGEIEDAEDAGNPGRAEALRSERDALVRELAAAAGLGRRDRKLGDEAERARKTVSARVRDALAKIGQVHPELADHLRSSLRMGTQCSYSPAEPVTWKMS